ncbi:MAG: alpha/beta fold hydrolase [Actinomycetota bacterium]
MPTAEVSGLTINYRDTGGGGRPVLLLHAFPFDSRMWDAQFDALGGRFRLIAPDLKGFGDSDAPDDPAAYSMDSYADEVGGLLASLGLPKVVLAGLSMGGYILLAFWRRHRDAVRALVLADTRAEADTPEGVERRSAQQDQLRAEGIAPLVEALPQGLLGRTTWEKKPDVVARIRTLMDNPPSGWIGALEAMKTRPDSTGGLTSISAPTLVIVGEEDGIAPPESARKMHEHIGGSRLVVIPEAGHLSNVEAPDAFNGALAEFLGDLGPAP